MTKFLHIADIHLGINQYNSPDNTRKKDFFYTFRDVIDRYAIEEKVDFVLIAGDLFDKNRIDPNTLNQAIVVLKSLKDSNIPVFAIEGNHDSSIGSDSVSWLQFLGEHNYIHFLNKDKNTNSILFNKNSEESNIYGCYHLNDQIRIIGIEWLGANTGKAIPDIANAIKSLGNYPYTILMLHAGVEGFLAGYGTITKASLEPLKPYVDYLALGHIHKHYIYEDWVFNPGSLEACCFPEYFDQHGALVVKIDKNNNTTYKLKENYRKREFIRITVDISRCNTAEDAIEKATTIIKNTRKFNKDKPVIELLIDGALEFKRSELNTDILKNITKEHLDALLVLVKYFARPKEYAIGANLTERSNREQVELTVINDMLAPYEIYKNNTEKVAKTLINLKDMVLNCEDNDNILNYLKENVTFSSINNENN